MEKGGKPWRGREMKFVHLYVKESYRLTTNPFTDWATGIAVGGFIISVILTALGKVLVAVFI